MSETQTIEPRGMTPLDLAMLAVGVAAALALERTSGYPMGPALARTPIEPIFLAATLSIALVRAFDPAWRRWLNVGYDEGRTESLPREA